MLILTLLQMLKRPCMLSLTVCVVAIYVLEYPETIQRNTFRQLVLLIVCSWLYDFVTLFFIESSAADEDEEDGGNEFKLRRFTRMFSYIALLFKLVVVVVFWKDSLDFRNIIHDKTPDDQIEEIIAQY